MARPRSLPPPSPTTAASHWRPEDSRTVQSPWIWRGFLLMALVAVGLGISFLGVGWYFYATAWGVIAVGWFATAMWLWRKHLRP